MIDLVHPTCQTFEGILWSALWIWALWTLDGWVAWPQDMRGEFSCIDYVFPIWALHWSSVAQASSNSIQCLWRLWRLRFCTVSLHWCLTIVISPYPPIFHSCLPIATAFNRPFAPVRLLIAAQADHFTKANEDDEMSRAYASFSLMCIDEHTSWKEIAWHCHFPPLTIDSLDHCSRAVLPQRTTPWLSALARAELERSLKKRQLRREVARKWGCWCGCHMMPLLSWRCS